MSSPWLAMAHPAPTMVRKTTEPTSVSPLRLKLVALRTFRPETFAAIDHLNLVADTGLKPQAVLFSTRCFKQRGAVLSNPLRGCA